MISILQSMLRIPFAKKQIVASKHSVQFQHDHAQLLFNRLKTVCFMVVFTYPLYLCVDIYFLQTRDERTNIAVLSFIHFLSFFLSFIFLLIHKKSRRTLFHQETRLRCVYFYLSFYLLIGAASSLNSQFLSDNIYAYIIILIASAAIFPVHPGSMAAILSSVHLLFISGLYIIEGFSFSTMMDTINSTAAAGISCLLAFTFYTHRRKEFMHKMYTKENENMFRRLFDANPYPLILTRISDDRILLLNKQAIDYYQDTELAQRKASFFFKDQEEQERVLQTLKQKQVMKNYLSTRLFPDRKTAWTMMNFELVDYFQEPCLLIGIMDVTEFKKKEEKLFQHASIDELTGVFNRRRGFVILEEWMGPSSPVHSFTLCYIDLNNLKMVNDQLGHKAGDEFIKTICRVIKYSIRAGDMLFRMGGDEFIVLFPHQQIEEAEQTWQMIQRHFDQINASFSFPYFLSASRGFHYYQPDMCLSPEELLAAADKEMYKEKAAYKQTAR